MRQDLPLADLFAGDPRVEILEDCREPLGYLLVRCPNDDGSANHALHICNPRHGLPAHAYCLNEQCKDVTAAEFIRLLGVSTRVY